MRIFNNFKSKEKNENSNKDDILTIPCDYDGYDISFEENFTNVELYKDINNIVTVGKVDINSIEEYKRLNTNSSVDEFLNFYDLWLDILKKENYIIHLDNSMNITEFVNKINILLKNVDSSDTLDVNLISELYKRELANYTFNNQEVSDNFNYDILEANIVAGELRKIGYELICFYIGFDNNDKTIIKMTDIDKMKEIESKINNN
jgi:hypothetical protein